MNEEIIIFTQIVFIDLVLAGDNAIIIGMVASQFPAAERKKNYFLGNWWSCRIKNNTNSFNCILVTNNWSKINWWFSVIIYLL